MAVIEIARIQVRRGQENQTGVPPLAGGEFAWAADTEKLYIGLRREDGGSRDANVEVLTEQHLRNLFEFTVNTVTSYVYRYGSDITAEVSTEYERNLLDKLDDQVSVKDFGIEGNGVDDVTALLRMTVDRLFLSTSTYQPYPGVSAAKVLYFPTGVYNISDTIFIPKNTIIKGEGIDNTIINLTTTGTHVFETVDSSSVGSTMGGDSGYVRFPFINSGDTQPDNIVIEGMTLQNSVSNTITGVLSLVKLAASSNSIIRRVQFKGTRVTGGAVIDDLAGVELLGYEALTSKNVKIEDCEFFGLTHGIKSNHDILNPIVNTSVFKDSYRGITFNDPIDGLATIGPRFARIMNSRFEDIEAEAIYVGENSTNTSTNHVSMHNQFVNVGNYNNAWGEESTTGTSVITFETNNNSSVNDYFDRAEFQLRNAGSSYTFNPLISGSSAIDSSYSAVVIVSASTDSCLLRIPITENIQCLTVKYTLTDDAPTDRTGMLRVNIGAGASPAVSITDDYDYTTASEGNIGWNSTVNSTYKWVELILSNYGATTITVEYQSNLLL